MDWSHGVDAYCERTGPEFWSEPVNALTNVAFIIAAALMAARLRGSQIAFGGLLVSLLALIGFGSFLFHTLAVRWAGLMDILPIAAFVMVYLYAANRSFLGMAPAAAVLAALAGLPAAALGRELFRQVPVIGVSAVYWPMPVLIAVYSAILWRRYPPLSRGLAIGAGILAISLVVRSLDEQFCNMFPLGTHYLWHVMNAVMLAWMIEVYRTHMLAARTDGG